MAPPVPLSPWATQKMILSRPANIFDVGAFKGNVVAKYRETFPNARIFCFEPLEAMVRQLTTRFKTDKNVHVIAHALSDKVGEETLYVGGRGGNMSSLNPRPPYGRRYYRHLLKPSGKVPTTTIDAFTKEWNIAHINIVKVDIHGAEHAMLRGAAEHLTRQTIDLIYVETYFIPLYANTMLFPDLCVFLGGYGYTIHSMHHTEYAKWNKQIRLTNALFVSSLVRTKILNAFTDEWKMGAPK